MQINSLKNRNDIISKYRSIVAGLEEQLEFYKKEGEKNKQLYSGKEGELEGEMR